MRLTPPALAALALALAFGAGGCSSPDEAVERSSRGTSAADSTAPAENLILVTLDTLRADAVGRVVDGRPVTPLLDRIAADGRSWTRAHAHSVMTLPSHANLLTGRLPFQHGVRSNAGFRVPEGETTLAEILQAEGFATAAFVAAFPLDARFGLAQGFDVYDDSYPEGGSSTDFATPERPASEVVAGALDWWRRHEGERRFLWVHLFEPHAPYEPSPPFADLWSADPYLGEAATADDALRPLLEPLLDERDSSTLVAVTADHGEALGEHGEETHGLFAYEEVLAVPLLMRGPGVAPGADDRPAGHVDLVPTLLARLGVETPDGLPGRDLLAADPPPPAPLYFEAVDSYYNRRWAPLRGVLAGDLKAIELPIPELYDLAADPAEEENLFDERRSGFRDLLASGPSDEPWPPASRGDAAPDEEVARKLTALGYVTGGGEGSRRTFGPEDDPKRLVELDRDLHRLIDRYQRGEHDEAIRIGRSLIERRPDLAVAAYFVSQAQLEAGRPADALSTLAAARDRGGSYPAANRQLALLLLQAGRAEEARRVAAEQADATPDPDSLAVLALAEAAVGDRAGARETLQRALEADPENPTAREHLALLALEEEAWKEAEDQARLALDANPDLPRAWNYLGVARSGQGDAAGALAAWERALALDPANFDVTHNLAVVAVRRGEIDRGVRALRSFVAASRPDDPSRVRALAMLRELGADT